MANEFDFSLDSLELADDQGLSYDADNYQDQVSPAPPAKGNYAVIALGFKARTTKDGKTITEAGGFPMFQIPVINIVDGLGEGVERKVGIFADVKTKPYDRYGTVVSGLGDLTRALGSPNWSGMEGGLAAVREGFESNTAFKVQLDWEIYDKDFIDAAFEQLGVPTDKDARTDADKKLVGAIYNIGRVKGMQYFPYNEERGVFSHVFQRGNLTFTSPVTNAPVTVEVEHRAYEAKPVLSRYFPANENVKLGPIKTKPSKLKGLL